MFFKCHSFCTPPFLLLYYMKLTNSRQCFSEIFFFPPLPPRLLHLYETKWFIKSYHLAHYISKRRRQGGKGALPPTRAGKFYPPPQSHNLVYALSISRNCIIRGHIVTFMYCGLKNLFMDADIIKILSQIPTSNKTKSSLNLDGSETLELVRFNFKRFN